MSVHTGGHEAWHFNGVVPSTDNAAAVLYLTESTVNRLVSTLADIALVLDAQGDMAPTTNRLIRELTRRITEEVLIWIERWPN